MPTPHTPSKFLLQTLAIIAIISLSIPATTFAVTSNSGTSQANSASKSSGMSKSTASDGASKGKSGFGSGNSVSRDNQRGDSRGSANAGTQGSYSSGNSVSRDNQRGDSRGSANAGTQGSYSRDSGGQGDGDGSRSGNGGDNNQPPPSYFSRAAAAVSNAVAQAQRIVNAGTEAIRATLNGAKKAAGLPSGESFGSLPGSIQKPVQPTITKPAEQNNQSPKTDTNVPDQIREQMEKQKVANGGLTDAQVKEYEQMNLDEAKRGFQKELNERAKGIYTSMDDAKREADLANAGEGDGSVPGGERKNERDAAVPQSLLDKYKAFDSATPFSSVPENGTSPNVKKDEARLPNESSLPGVPEPDKKTPGALTSEQEQKLADEAEAKRAAEKPKQYKVYVTTEDDPTLPPRQVVFEANPKLAGKIATAYIDGFEVKVEFNNEGIPLGTPKPKEPAPVTRSVATPAPKETPLKGPDDVRSELAQKAPTSKQAGPDDVRNELAKQAAKGQTKSLSSLPPAEKLNVADVNAAIDKINKGPKPDFDSGAQRDKDGNLVPFNMAKLELLNQAQVVKDKNDINGRLIKPLNISDETKAKIADNYKPVAERIGGLEKVPVNKETLAKDWQEAVLKNQAETVNYENRKAPGYKTLNIQDISPEDKVQLTIRLAQQKTHFRATDIAEGVKDSKTGEDLKTGIIDTSYDADPRKYKVTGPMSLPLLGNFDKNIEMIDGAIDTPEKVRDITMSVLTDVYGIPKNAAAGIVGNIGQESSYRPDVENDIGAQGLFQYLSPDRQEALKQFSGTDKPGIEAQTSNAIAEFSGTHPHIKDTQAMKFGKSLEKNPNISVEEAAVKFRKNFERPGEDEAHDDKRIAYAQQALKSYDNPQTPDTDASRSLKANNAPDEENASPSETDAGPYDETAPDEEQQVPPEEERVIKPSEAYDKATAADDNGNPIVEGVKAGLRIAKPRAILAIGDGAVEGIRRIGRLFGINLPSGPGLKRTFQEDELWDGSRTNDNLFYPDVPIQNRLDASQFSPAQNAQTLVNNVLTQNSQNITSFIPSPDSSEAKAGLIRRITTTIDKTTYVVELRSRLTLSEKFIVVNATPNVAGAKVTFSYTDNGPDGTLDTFSANGVNLNGSAISNEVRKKFEEEIQKLTNLYYKSL